MKKTIIAIAAFVCGALFVACTEKLEANEAVRPMDERILKEVVYNYQRIMDTCVSDELWGDVICEGNEWAGICEAVGSPYDDEIPEFWAEYSCER